MNFVLLNEIIANFPVKCHVNVFQLQICERSMPQVCAEDQFSSFVSTRSYSMIVLAIQVLTISQNTDKNPISVPSATIRLSLRLFPYRRENSSSNQVKSNARRQAKASYAE